MRIATMALAVLLTTPLLAWSADPHAAPAHGATAELPYPHPRLPVDNATWAGVALIVIAGMFLASAAIGPIVRANAPEEVPDAHSHDEHGPGAHDAVHAAGAHGHGHH
jgi:hypothetical protein